MKAGNWVVMLELIFLAGPFMLSILEFGLGTYMRCKNHNSLMIKLIVRADLVEHEVWVPPASKVGRWMAMLELWGMKLAQGPFSGLGKIGPEKMRFFPKWLKRLLVFRLLVMVGALLWFALLYIASHYR